MRVLLVDTVREIGGAQRSLLELANALAAMPDVQVVAAFPSGPLAEAVRRAGITVHAVPALRMHRGLSRLLLDAIQFARGIAPLRHIIRTTHPDLIHANGLTPTLLALRATEHVPVLWHVRDLSMPPALVRTIGERVAGAVAISEPVEERLCQTFPAFHRGRVHLVRNGIDTRHFVPGDQSTARRIFALPPDVPLVGMAAHLVPWKRHDHFVEIAAAIHEQRPDVHFVAAGRDLLGDHPRLRARLDAEVASRNLTAVWHWLPPIDDLAPLLPALDVLLHPAADEPFGRVLCEALACARPVVAADSAGPACIVPHGVAGFLVQPGRCDLFAARVLELLKQPEGARRMGEAGREYVTRHFDVARVAANIQRLYAAIMAERSHRTTMTATAGSRRSTTTTSRRVTGRRPPRRA